MIISRTPFRISYVGGGSDLPVFYQRYGGAVLSSTISKYMYISSHDYFDSMRLRVKYSEVETVDHSAELRHPLLRGILTRMGIRTGLEISSIADVPGGTGLGSSSSFAVGALHNLMYRLGRHGEATKSWLAQQACVVEIEDLGEPIGKQDQYAASFGGLNVFRFMPDESVIVEPVVIPDAVGWLKNLRMYYLGRQRSASSVLSNQKSESLKREKQDVLRDMVSLVDPLAAALTASDWGEAGRLMHENWRLKQSLAKGITDDGIQEVYRQGLKAGAKGGKLLGAGGGGFMLFVVEPDKRALLDEALSSFRPVSFSWDTNGSQIIYSEEYVN